MTGGRAFALIASLLAAGGAARAGTFSLSSGTLACDYLEYRSSESVVTARGNAVLVSSGTRLEADHLDLDLDNRTAHARGRVRVDDGAMGVLSDEVTFDAATSSGVFVNGYFEDPPYRLWARRIVRVSSDLYHMEHAAMTSCDLDPPHYHVRIAKLDYVPGRWAKATWPRLALGDASILGLPYYSKTFRKKPWSLTVDPGRSSYHGVYAKSIFSYRLTDHGTARVYWDHFHKTGEGLGAEYTYGSPWASGSFYGYRTEDRVAGTHRWNARAAHWQELKPGLTVEVNGLAQSDAGFNNLYFKDDLFRVRTEAQSSGALSLHRPAYTARLSARHDRVFDPVRGSFVTLRTVLPELSLQGSPWRLGRNTYLTSALTLRRQYERPTADPALIHPLISDKDRFRGTGEASVSLRRSIPLGRRVVLEPSAGASGAWQSWRDLGAARDPHDFFQGRGFTGLALRHRLTRSLEYDLSHVYRVRWSPNQVKRDHADAADQGLEAHQLSFVGNYRGRTASGRLSTGYDLRDREGETLMTPRRKTVPPALDLSWRPAPWTGFSYRQVYDLHPARHVDSARFSWRLGRVSDLQFSSGYSYNGASPGMLQLRHGASFPVTRGWRLETAVRWQLEGPGRLRYDSAPKERFEQEYVVRRDLHCWRSRITFRKRPGFTEAYVRVDLKSHAGARRDLSTSDEDQYFPGREKE